MFFTVSQMLVEDDPPINSNYKKDNDKVSQWFKQFLKDYAGNGSWIQKNSSNLKDKVISWWNGAKPSQEEELQAALETMAVLFFIQVILPEMERNRGR